MKKLLMMSVVTLAFSVAPALAEPHGGPRDGSGDGKGGAMFQKHDTNGDGFVSQEEFLDHAKQRFDDMDGDGDGKISKEEAQAHHAEMKEKWKEKREERMEKREERMEKRMEKREGAPETSDE